MACLLCACLVIGAGAGIGGALLVTGMNDPAEKQTVNVGNNADSGSQNSGGDTATFYQSSGTQVIVQNTGVGSASGSKMTVAEVIAAVKDSVVEITTETVVRGSRFSQYVTSGAGSGVIIAKEAMLLPTIMSLTVLIPWLSAPLTAPSMPLRWSALMRPATSLC